LRLSARSARLLERRPPVREQVLAASGDALHAYREWR